MFRAFVLVSFALLSLTQVAAQEDSLRHQFVERFPDKFFIWPLIKERELNFAISNRYDDSQKLTYKPNNSYSAGLGFYLFEVTVELSMAIPLNEKNRSTYGASEIRDVQMNVLGKYWGVDLYNQNYSGFYVPNRNPTPALPDPFVKRPDVKVVNTGTSFIYAFNHKKYSLRAAFNYSERQVKSAGSFILAGTINSVRLQADSSLLAQIYSPDLYSVSSFRKLQYAAFGLAPGYAYSLVYKSFFLNAAVSYGPAHYWIQYTAQDQSDYDMSINTYADVRFSIGYNSDRFFGGLSYISQARDFRFEDVQFSNSSSWLKLLVGYRFQEKGVLKKRAADFVPVGGNR